MTSPANYTTRIPPGIPDAQVGPLVCAGVTMYRALQVRNVWCQSIFNPLMPSQLSRVAKDQWVVIIGAGGGLGHLWVAAHFLGIWH